MGPLAFGRCVLKNGSDFSILIEIQMIFHNLNCGASQFQLSQWVLVNNFFFCLFSWPLCNDHIAVNVVAFSDGDFFHWQLYDATLAPQQAGLSNCLSLCTLGLCLWDFADWTPLADPVYIVLTRWASTSSSGQNDFPDLSHPHLPFNLLLSNSASYISPQPFPPRQPL